MKSYTIFAGVYDDFMWDIPYGEWKKKVINAFDTLNISCNRVLELGCGTGNFTFELENAGYNVTGTDLSESMIKQAVKKKKRNHYTSEFHIMDMRKISSGSAYDSVVCVCDGMNYLVTGSELLDTMKSAYGCLKWGGAFIFDMKTPAFYRQLADNVYTDEIDRGSYIWENDYDENTGNNDYYLTFYLKKCFGLYKKYTEEHTQHAFTKEEIEEAAITAGFKIKTISENDFTQDRVFYVLGKE